MQWSVRLFVFCLCLLLIGQQIVILIGGGGNGILLIFLCNISRIFLLVYPYYLLLLFCCKMSRFLCGLCSNCQQRSNTWCSFSWASVDHISHSTSSHGLLPLLLGTCTWWCELRNLSRVISFFQCLKSPAHDRRRQHAESSMNCIAEMFQISEAVLHLWKMMCIFRHVLTSDRFHTVFISHAHNGYIMVGLQRNYVWYSKVETMQHWSWILYAVFCLCHVIEDKCWERSFKQSMRLKCTARKECIKYINKFYICGELCSRNDTCTTRKRCHWNLMKSCWQESSN